VNKAREKALQMRAELWPGLVEGDIWDRKLHTGFTTLPRTLVIITAIIDSLTKNHPAGRSYLVLWFRAYDEMILTIESPNVIAAESGFTGERAVSTWRSRMKSLCDLGFIEAKKGASGDYHYVLLRNPHKVVWALKDQIQDVLFTQLMERAHDIGAKDFKKPEGSGAQSAKPSAAKSPKHASAA
jgi:hypothetical protein